MSLELYYLTRTWAPTATGGSLMRQAQVGFFQQAGFRVHVVTPNYGKHKNARIVEKVENGVNVIRIPYIFSRRYSLGERIGLYPDYLNPWADMAYAFLKPRIMKSHIVFATTGGEMATLLLGARLKQKCGATYAAQYRDPVLYTLIHGRKVDSKYHVSREGQEHFALRHADLITASSRSLADNLRLKYPDLEQKIRHDYFGYVEPVNLSAAGQAESAVNSALTVSYGGAFNATQSPEILSQAYAALPSRTGINIAYVGKHQDYGPFKERPELISEATVAGPFPREVYLTWMLEHADVGFVCLRSIYYGVCVPSKIYEYINLGLPMLACLPPGDAAEIIEGQGFGLCCETGDIEGLSAALDRFRTNPDLLQNCRKSVLEKREQWSMQQLMTPLIEAIKAVNAETVI
jgi:glycosyltransferase involved in cell wall biosynthesis